MKHPLKNSAARGGMLVLWFLLTINMHAEAASPSRSIKQQTPRIYEITIFVHGVIGIKLALSFYHLTKFMNDSIGNTVYAKTIEGLRSDPFFHQGQPIAELGLKKLEIEDLEIGNAAGIAAYLYDSVDAYTASLQKNIQLTTIDTEPTPQSSPFRASSGFALETRHQYYTYGWSGLLSKKTRKEEAEQFYTALEQLCSEIRAQQGIPKLRLIGFSHGGNLCIQLANAQKKLSKKNSFVVDELILIGTPIIEESKIALTDPLFNKIYNIYSRNDSIQKMEIFSDKIFSEQKFTSSKNEPLPAKLTQIEIKVEKDRIKKNRYTKKEKKLGTDDYSPGHMELWFFGWTPGHYRKEYPLYPLPTMVVFPYIIHHLHTFPEIHLQNIVVTLHPEQHTMAINGQEIPFVSPEALTLLKKVALDYKPAENSIAEYREHWKKAYWAARDEKDLFKKR